VTNASPPIRRCAIYTRKSSEEGLEQDFNAALALFCPKCHAENPPGFKFCGQCTAALTPAVAKPPAVESAVTIREAGETAAIEGERKTGAIGPTITTESSAIRAPASDGQIWTTIARS
jgi:hypothetical protein